ncbi:MAG: DNA polymerase III subunit gamma/tau [Paracoccaceae bacterium]
MTETPDAGPYQVLARKYRPADFSELIGQEAMVRTLTAAFETGRIAHAFVLTGVRGVGKTTTARIIAKGLNCLAHDRPTIAPCGVCAACTGIARGSHVDVLEMDAASNTGVDYIREINEAVRYRPTEVRYKVYIIDEVHMLSTASFNALLKTLEEPPAHVKFILATTEIRKVPVTVLSRCQRFDLRRIEPEAMMAHLAAVAAAEGAALEAGALALVARAAEGSVRDALSLLDQAIAPGAEASAEAVRAMLGLADRGRVIDLFEAVMRGDAAGALAELSGQYAEGADPALVLRDLAELTHWISVLKISPEAAEDPTASPEERRRGAELAERLSMRVLTRTWQMLLKAMEEVPLAPNAMMAAEMALIRLSHVADLPPPEELVRRLTADEGTGPPRAGGQGGTGGRGGPSARLRAVDGGPAAASRMAAAPVPEPVSVPKPVPVPGHVEARDSAAAADPLARLAAFEDVLALLSEAREYVLLEALESFARVVSYRPGALEINPAPGAPADLAGRTGATLRALTGQPWQVAVSGAPGLPTPAETARAARDTRLARAAEEPMVAAALALFPGATLLPIRDVPAPGGAGAGDRASDDPAWDAPAWDDAAGLEPAGEADGLGDGDVFDPEDPFEED